MTNKRQNPTESNSCSSPNSGGIYGIKIRRLLDNHWRQWFEGITLERQESAKARQDGTLIIGPGADQPALHGLLSKIRDPNLALISVRKLDPKRSLKRESDQHDVMLIQNLLGRSRREGPSPLFEYIAHPGDHAWHYDFMWQRIKERIRTNLLALPVLHL